MDDNIIKSKGLTKSDNIIKGDRPRALKARKKKTTAQKTQVRISETNLETGP
jgi:hypothetical protein